MSNMIRRGEALPSVEKARALLLRSRDHGEIRRIRAIAQAIATLERGKEIACDAGEIIVMADTRRAELEAEERATRKPGPKKNSLLGTQGTIPQRQLEAESRRAPLRSLPEPDRDAYFSACRKALQPPSTSGAAALARLKPEKRKEALSRLGHMPDVRRVIGEVRRRERNERLAEISKGNVELGTAQRFPIVYADPPWRYEHVKTDSRAIENQYPTMALEEICALPVGKLATDDAVLFLWATSPKLAEALSVVGAWGFTYRTGMVWVKEQIGMGYWARQQHEHVLIATRGDPPAPAEADRPSSVILAPRGKHSAKPHEFAETIERMFPALPKVELFCRSPRDGWAAWGNQA